MLGIQDGTGQGSQWLIECPVVMNPHLNIPRFFLIVTFLILLHLYPTSMWGRYGTIVASM